MNTQVIILNGKATSGKNSFVDKLNEYIPTTHYSYVDFTREMLRNMGIPVDEKTEEMRKLLCDINNCLEEYNSIPFTDCMDVYSDFLSGLYESDVLVIDCREPEKIERLKNSMDGAITVFVDNVNVPLITTNSADSKVMDYVYDYVVNNSGNINNLDKEVERFAEYIHRRMNT